VTEEERKHHSHHHHHHYCACDSVSDPFSLTSDVISGDRFSHSLERSVIPMAALHCLESSWKEDTEFRYWWSSSVRLLRALLLLIGSLLLLCFLCFYGPGLLLTRANELGRQCIELRKSWPYNNKNQYHQHHPHHNRFALVTCSDGLTTIPQRSFEGMMELITPNRKRYVERHGYQFIDASGTLDKDRPPSWSKILAVKTHLSAYDWVFWNDAVCSPSPSLLLLQCRLCDLQFFY